MRRSWKDYFRIICILLSVLIIAETTQATGYDIVNRFKLLEDKFKTNEMLTPLGHDFLFDVGILLNKDLFDVIDEVDKVSDTPGDTTAKLAAAQALLRKYDKTEQNVRFRLNLGFPLPSFTAFGVKIIPDFRTHVGLGILLGFRSSNLSVADLIAQAAEYLGSDIPDAIKNKLSIAACTSGMTAGTDIVQHMINTSGCGLSEAEKALVTPFVGKYKLPSDTTIPDIHNYIKGEAKVGFNFNYIYDEHFFGTLALYGLGRADMKVRVSADALANKGEVGDLGEELNTTVNLASDYRFGYKNGNLRGWAAIEEIKLSRMSDNEEKAGALRFGDDPLLRVHGEYLYKLSIFNVKPFVGVHKRSGYGFGDGLYAGADMGMYVWGDRLGLRLRTMVDNEHFTLSPMAKLWFMHLDYMLKAPLKSEVDGVKPSALHSLNFRLFF